ncbi:MAG TPA: hypothetical protein VJ850_12760 [Candidatus Limnocylindrales bacterium]|nr:hypothetical protein [Candidatus Limnocylindrales bacterium]
MHRTIRALGLTAAGALLIAACGGNAATTAPTTAAATTPPATAAATEATTPTEVPGASGALPSFDLSSFHGDQDLESLIPKSIAGENLTVLSMTGDQFLGGDTASPELGDALKALGKTPADLGVAFAGSTKITIVAFRVKGVPADALFTAFKNAQTDQFTSENVSYGGKSVTKITPSDGSIAFIYVKDDAMFVVGSSGSSVPTDALLNEAFQKLP